MEWKPLIYHGEYFGDTHKISKDGKLRNTKTHKELKQNINKQGYLMTVISRGKERKIAIKIHRAVAENFVSGFSNDLVVNHIDGNKTNNYYLNLEWVTKKQNSIHASKNGLLKNKKGCDVYNSSLNEDDVRKIRFMLQNGQKQIQIANMYNVSVDVIYHIAHNHTYKNVV